MFRRGATSRIRRADDQGGMRITFLYLMSLGAAWGKGYFACHVARCSNELLANQMEVPSFNNRMRYLTSANPTTTIRIITYCELSQLHEQRGEGIDFSF
jgi:hypothetical protein